MGYIDVDNVDQYINEVVRIGGTVQRAAEDIPGVGRYAIVADPNGAAFTLFTSLTGQTPDRVRPEQYGRVAWHELETPDINGSFSFYSSLFGWKKERAARPSERDGYQLFAEDGTLLGRLTETSSRKRGAFWRYAFNVQNIGAAIERVKGKGGHATEDPVPNVGDSLLARCMDPQGAEFAVIQLTK